MGSHASWIRNAQIVILTVCVVVSGQTFLSPHAHAADDTFNRNAADDIAQDRQVFDGYDGGNKDTVKSAAPASISPSYQSLLEQRLSETEKQIRELTGKLEQVSFENETLKKNLEKSQADFDIRLNELKTSIDSKPAAAVSAQVTETQPAGTLSDSDKKDVPADTNADTNTTAPATNLDGAAPADSPTQKTLGTITKAPNGAAIAPDKSKDAAGIYEDAYAALKAGKAADAQTKFTNFLKQFPEHPLKANAVYWLGETYYAQGNYAQSTRVFAESYKKFPKGPKAADSLLKMGMSLAQNNKTKEACVTFKQLKKEYATGQTALINRADAEMTKIACK